jgi:hypothetical protein
MSRREAKVGAEKGTTRQDAFIARARGWPSQRVPHDLGLDFVRELVRFLNSGRARFDSCWTRTGSLSNGHDSMLRVGSRA